MTMTSSPPTSVCGDSVYETQLTGGPLEFCGHLSVIDAAFVLGACADRGVSLEQAVTEALVGWAAT